MNYTHIYNKLINKRLACTPVGYSEVHHIIPKCLGGTNNVNNLVRLTAREHYVAHKLLCRVYPHNKKLKIALWRFITGNSKQQNISSKDYQAIKKKLKPIFSEISIKNWNDELYRSNLINKITNRWKNPEFKSKMRDKLVQANSRQSTIDKRHKSLKDHWKYVRGLTPILVWECIEINRGGNGKGAYKYKKTKLVGQFDKSKDAAKNLNLLTSKISQCLKGHRKTHKGYIFEYAGDSNA